MTEPVQAASATRTLASHAAIGERASVVGVYGPGELLGVVGGELAARGLDVRDLRVGGLLAAIEVINPVDTDRGIVRVGRDGHLFWERWIPLNGRVAASRVIDSAGRMLEADSGQAR